MTNEKLLFELFEKYGLVYDKDHPESKENDVYRHKHYTIITRQGIQKIEKAANIECKFTPVQNGCGKDFITLICTGIIKGPVNENGIFKIIKEYRTLASASDLTSTNKYYAEMAEKRGRSRLVLTLVGLYELGVYGQDEADDFDAAVKGAQKSSTWSAAQYKGGAQTSTSTNAAG